MLSFGICQTFGKVGDSVVESEAAHRQLRLFRLILLVLGCAFLYKDHCGLYLFLPLAGVHCCLYMCDDDNLALQAQVSESVCRARFRQSYYITIFFVTVFSAVAALTITAP